METTRRLPSYAMGKASFPQMYEARLVGPLFRPWAEMTVEELALSPGESLLDLACGTGIVARVARERLGDAAHIVGVDLSLDMLAVARSISPGIDWREGDAGALPLREGERFDALICQQGLQFFPDKPAAATEMRRALKKGGRLAVTTWRSDDEIPFFQELREVAERRLGAIADMRYSFGDATALETLLRDAGFQNVRVRTVSRIIRFEDGASFLRLNAMALVGMSSSGKTFSDEARNDVVEMIVGDSVSVMSSYTSATGLAFELSTNLATARG